MAAEAFGHRAPEMYGGEQRTGGSAPPPHPAACRPAATAAAGVLFLATMASIRPDAPARAVPLRPLCGAPLGEVGPAGLRLCGAAFSVRVGRLGPALVEEAADGLRRGM